MKINTHDHMHPYHTNQHSYRRPHSFPAFFAGRLILALLLLAVYIYAPHLPIPHASEATERIYAEITCEDFYTNLQNYVMILMDNNNAAADSEAQDP